MLNRREETKTVKKALQANGYDNVRVGHGSGTARFWLYITIPQDAWTQRQDVIGIAQHVTGRHGEYDGNINIYTDNN